MQHISKHITTEVTVNGHQTWVADSAVGTIMAARLIDWVLPNWLELFLAKNRKYADGVTKGLDYLLGRNTFSTSFVTGTGTTFVKQPHHRFWAGVLNPDFPFAPPGALSGGPNAGLQDPVAKVQLAACVAKPATCWMDDIQAYSVNEVTINWNAPWAWLLDFQNDRADAAAALRSARK